jgi:hypothetical protein
MRSTLDLYGITMSMIEELYISKKPVGKNISKQQTLKRSALPPNEWEPT